MKALSFKEHGVWLEHAKANSNKVDLPRLFNNAKTQSCSVGEFCVGNSTIAFVYAKNAISLLALSSDLELRIRASNIYTPVTSLRFCIVVT